MRRADLMVNASIYLVEMLCRHGAINETDVRFLEAQIVKATHRLSRSDQRDALQILQSRKKNWDRYLEETIEQPAITRLFDTDVLNKELQDEDAA